jgi:hypothetical protein
MPKQRSEEIRGNYFNIVLKKLDSLIILRIIQIDDETETLLERASSYGQPKKTNTDNFGNINFTRRKLRVRKGDVSYNYNQKK